MNRKNCPIRKDGIFGMITLMSDDTKTTPPAFIEWLNAELTKRNLADSEASRLAGLSHGAIYDARAGIRPGVAKCRALARLFGYPEEYVLRLAGHLSTPSKNVEDLDEYTRHRLQEVARKLTLLEPEERERITRQYLTQLDFALALKGIEEEEHHEVT